jgi:two-component system, cell cycle sensor histidine kinase and response regulator CckA
MTRASILIVEDESIVAKDVRSRLTRLGYTIAGVTATGEDAVELAGNTRPGLVLMDIMLKGEMDGITAAEIIRSRYDIPVVFLTAFADDQTIQRAKLTQASGYLLKPFEERELQITIEMSLYKHTMEHRLRRNEQWLSVTLRSMGEGVIAGDRAGRVTFLNTVAEHLVGMTEREAVGRPLAEVWRTEEEGGPYVAPHSGRAGSRPLVLLAAGGRRVPVDAISSPLVDDAGEESGSVIVFRDVTERRLAERRVAESEARLRTFFDSSFQGHLLLDREATILSLNRLARELLREAWGREPEQGDDLRAVAPAGFARQFSLRLEQCLRGERVEDDLEITALQGGKRTFSVVYHPVSDERGAVTGVSMNILETSEHTAAERALRASEERIAGIITSTMDAIVSLDERQRIVVFNTAAERMFQCRAAEALGQSIDRFIPSQHRELHRRQVGEFGRTQVTNRRMGSLGLVRGVRSNGEEFPIEASISQLLTGSGKIYTVILRDITERVQAEQALRASEERYRTFYENDLTANYAALADGRITDCNPAFVRIFGFAGREDALGKNIFDLYPGEDRRKAFMDQLMAHGRLEYQEKALVRPDGAEVSVVENTIAEFSPDGRLREFVGYLFDDTERKRLEEQLRQSQKMEGIGTLASGIAHDFNNILNNVLGFATQMRKHVHDQTRVLRYSQNIEKSAARGAELSQQLLSFARVSKREYAPMNIEPIVDEVLGLCRETFPRSITILRSVDAPLRFVHGDRGALYQVLLNLCLNARDAVLGTPGGAGTLEITARTALVGEDVSSALLGVQDPYCVELRVRDTGTGIPKEIRQRIFDPFFTTKERGRGTGLGLSVVYSIVRNHRGILQVESEEGSGTTFRIFLPAIQELPQAEKPVEAAPVERGKNELIMIVDDEESMQELASELLEEHGYSVVIAGNGRDAVEIYRRRGHEIALVVLDLVMPGMDGGQTYVELKALNPSLKAFFCTGFMPDHGIAALLERDRLRAIQKPFNPRTFVQVVREVLDERR